MASSPLHGVIINGSESLRRLSTELLSKVITIYPVSITARAQQIATLFSHGGPIRAIRYDYDDAGRQSSRVQIQFFLYESAGFVFKNARKERYLLNGTPIFVWSDMSRKWTKHRFGHSVEGHGTRIFVQGLSPSTTQQQLVQYFSQFGPLIDTQLFVRHGTSMCKATVTFSNAADASRVLQETPQQTFDGKRLDMKLDPTFRSLGDCI